MTDLKIGADTKAWREIADVLTKYSKTPSANAIGQEAARKTQIGTYAETIISGCKEAEGLLVVDLRSGVQRERES